MKISFNLSPDEVETLLAFIKMHEREDIPDDVWEIAEEMYEWLEDEL